MGLLAIFYEFIQKNKCIHDKKSYYIFYKIVDFFSGVFVLQCINTKAILHLKITEIVYDIDILYGLHPVQACYIGIEYSKYLKEINTSPPFKNPAYKPEKNSVFRYGKYRLCYQDREGKLCFVDETNQQEFIIDPRDIALSNDLINEFDAAQAFYIGLLAGIKMNSKVKSKNKSDKLQKPHLWIVK